MSMPAENKKESERPAATVSVLPGRSARPLKHRLRLPLMIAGPLIVLVLGGYYYVTGGRYVSTDDAYTQSARTTISANVGGEVAEIDVQDNQRVAKGDVLFKLDERPYQIALEEAQAQLAAAKLQVEALKATYRQKQSELKAAQDTAAFQQREFDRRKTLAENGVYPKAQLDQALHAAQNASQQVISTQQQMANILASLGGAVDMPVEKHPSIRQVQALVDRAALNLSYATVRAPEQGVVTKVEQLQVGDHINAATPVFSLVSTDDLWIEANFKETDLAHMRPGQTATIDVDSYPDRTFTAEVVSVSPGTGSVFSLLPAENATGNWVKVVQRLPVRLAIKDADPQRPLHAGLSATVEVDTHYEHPLMKFLHAAFASTGTRK